MSLLTREDLINFLWRFTRVDRPQEVTEIRLMEDGAISGRKSVNEALWKLDDKGVLCFMRADGVETARFETVVRTEFDIIVEGPHTLRPDKDIRLRMERRAPPLGYTANWTRYAFRDLVETRGWDIGEYTYGAPKLLSGEMADLKIGRFTSIATGVIIGIGNHRIDTVSSFPFPTLRRAWPKAPKVPDHATKGDVEIGSDVWIGINVFIASGIKIGHGAVIGAHSVVTRDVEPYAIVAGNPARFIRRRFAPEYIERLLRLAWWDWDYDRVNNALDYIMSDDIETFLRKAESGEL